MRTMRNFGRVIEVLTAGMKFSSDKYNIEGKVPFDNDTLPNESEIKIWNLAETTINNIKRGKVLMLNAGYKGDVGLLLHGYISNVDTVWEGVDKITTIHVLDSEDLDKREVKEIAFAENTLASKIIKQMASYIGLPIAQFSLNRDYRYQDGYTAKGKVTEIIAKVAKDCGTSVYINKNKLYVRNLRSGGDNVFAVNTKTGLIGTPGRFEKDGAKGFNIKMQLQHRVTTASVLNLSYSRFTGKAHVRSGSHTFSRTGDFVTEVEAIL
jgi:hypothetical protein